MEIKKLPLISSKTTFETIKNNVFQPRLVIEQVKHWLKVQAWSNWYG